jgi:hypothetical protein
MSQGFPPRQGRWKGAHHGANGILGNCGNSRCSVRRTSMTRCTPPSGPVAHALISIPLGGPILCPEGTTSQSPGLRSYPGCPVRVVSYAKGVVSEGATSTGARPVPQPLRGRALLPSPVGTGAAAPVAGKIQIKIRAHATGSSPTPLPVRTTTPFEPPPQTSVPLTPRLTSPGSVRSRPPTVRHHCGLGRLM